VTLHGNALPLSAAKIQTQGVGPFPAFDRKLLYLSFVAALATPLILNERAPQRAVRAEDAAILFEKTE